MSTYFRKNYHSTIQIFYHFIIINSPHQFHPTSGLSKHFPWLANMSVCLTPPHTLIVQQWLHQSPYARSDSTGTDLKPLGSTPSPSSPTTPSKTPRDPPVTLTRSSMCPSPVFASQALQLSPPQPQLPQKRPSGFLTKT